MIVHKNSCKIINVLFHFLELAFLSIVRASGMEAVNIIYFFVKYLPFGVMVTQYVIHFHNESHCFFLNRFLELLEKFENFVVVILVV